MHPGCRNYGNDTEQSGPESGPASARAHHLRRQRSRLPELGPVPSDDEISRHNDGAADPRDVLRPSSRTLPEPQGRPESHRDQRNGDPELLLAGQLGALQRHGSIPIRPDDSRLLYVHWTSGHCPRNHDNGYERRTQAAEGQRDRTFPREYGRHALRLRRPRRNVRGTA